MERGPHPKQNKLVSGFGNEAGMVQYVVRLTADSHKLSSMGRTLLLLGSFTRAGLSIHPRCILL